MAMGEGYGVVRDGSSVDDGGSVDNGGSVDHGGVDNGGCVVSNRFVDNSVETAT